MAVSILVGFVLAGFAPALHTLTRRGTGWLLAIYPLAVAGFLFSRLQPSAEFTPVSYSIPWVPSLGIELAFYLDGLSLLMGLLISGIGALVLIYTGGYLAGHPQQGRLYCFLLLFMASMLGLVFANNLIVLFLFWELTSISSYLLIGFDHQRAEARAAALQALLVTGAGGLALLAGALLLGHVAGSLEIQALLTQGALVRRHAYYVPILILFLGGAFTKSAQVPFHFWLPSAMEAPTPVSAYLHSATMVKAGIYLLARLTPVLGGTDAWHAIVTTFGTTTMVLGALLAMGQSDLKRILAYTTVSALGMLTMLLGVGSPMAVTAATMFLLAHALYKGALFLIAGAVDHETGTRDVNRLGGLGRAMPFTFVAALMAGISMAGVPPLLGFFAKEVVYDALLSANFAGMLVAFTVLTGMAFGALAGVIAIWPFLRRDSDMPRHPHPAPFSLWLGPLLLGSLGLAIGLLWGSVEPYLLSASAAILQAEPEPMHHHEGISTVLILSIGTLAGAVALYFAAAPLRRFLENLKILKWGPGWWYQLSLDALNGLARQHTRVVQSGNLRYYMMILLLTTIVLTLSPLLTFGLFPALGSFADLSMVDVGLIVLIIVAALLAVRQRERLSAIAILGVVGSAVALLFVTLGAPDLAMTQFLVEIFTLILFLLVFYHLRDVPTMSTPVARVRDAVLSAGVGLVIALLALNSMQYDRSTIADHYLQTSLAEAHGGNVVNVILVDYRGLDTLGEITVLSIASVGVYALLKLRMQKK